MNKQCVAGIFLAAPGTLYAGRKCLIVSSPQINLSTKTGKIVQSQNLHLLSFSYVVIYLYIIYQAAETLIRQRLILARWQ